MDIAPNHVAPRVATTSVQAEGVVADLDNRLSECVYWPFQK
jgi:hypothetical protein